MNMSDTSAKLGRYRLLNVIGTGGFSTVYRAIDERFDTQVAIKVLAENHAFNPEIRERFITEVQLLRRLAGIPTVAVYDLGETESGQPYAVMALADGDLVGRVTSLRSRQITIGPPEVNRIVDELTRSLSVLHAKGIVHRDVKPMNLLVFGDSEAANQSTALVGPIGFDRPTVGGSAKQRDQLLDDAESLRLADLGFAKDLAMQSGMTVGGGTPGFMPPEQAKPGRVDARADIYAATAVVAWLICGEVPVERTPQEIANWSADLIGDGSSAAGLLAGMALEPDDRPATMGEWRDLLQQTLTAPSLAVAPQWDPPVAQLTDGDPSPTSRPRGRAGLAAAAAVAGALELAAGWAGSGLLSGDGTSIGRTAEGVVYTQSVDDLTVAVTGPDEVLLGEAITFSAEVTGANQVRWVAPDGSLVDDDGPLSLRASNLGEGQVKLIATSPQGETVEVTAEFTVVDSAS